MSSAVGILGDPRNTIACRFYAAGNCRNERTCPFSHSEANVLPPSTVCRFFLNGLCNYGESCRFEHVRPEQEATVTEHFFANLSLSPGRKADSHHQTSPNKQRSYNNGASTLKNWLNVEAAEFVPGKSGAFSSASSPSYYNSFSGALGQNSNFPSSFGSSKRIKSTEMTGVPPDLFPANLNFQDHATNPPEFGELDEEQRNSTKDLLCPYFIQGECANGDACEFTHGDLCDLCLRPCMHPLKPKQNLQHRNECLAEHEKDMEESFAVARSSDKVCGICMETVLEKKGPPSVRRFGVLPGCKHVYCLDCIREWRKSKNFENNVIRSCPQCRTLSDFVIPSDVWVEEPEEKNGLVHAYKHATQTKPCKYFKDDLSSSSNQAVQVSTTIPQNGEAECPFGNKCFYRHANPDGTLVAGDSPRTIHRRLRQKESLGRQRSSVYGRRSSGWGEYMLWSFLEDRDLSSPTWIDWDSSDDTEVYDDPLPEPPRRSSAGRDGGARRSSNNTTSSSSSTARSSEARASGGGGGASGNNRGGALGRSNFSRGRGGANQPRGGRGGRGAASNSRAGNAASARQQRRTSTDMETFGMQFLLMHLDSGGADSPWDWPWDSSDSDD